MELKNTKDISLSSMIINAGVYGVSGSGKTTFGSTFPKPVFIDTDGGMLSLRGKDIPFFSLPPTTTNWWQSIRECTKQAISMDDRESVVIDSMTGIANACMTHVQMINKTTGKTPSFSDWDGLFNTLLNYINLVVQSNKHSLFICHEADVKNENTGRVWILPAIQGQMKNKMANYFDEFYHAEVDIFSGKPAVYKLLARANATYTAKSRLLKDPKMNYIEPNFKSIRQLAAVISN